MVGEFDWIAVRLTSSGSGKPYGSQGRLGAVVKVGLLWDDNVLEYEIPVLMDAASDLSVAEARDAALKAAVETLRGLLRTLDGQSFNQLAERQDRQDAERDQNWKDSLRSIPSRGADQQAT